MVQIWNNESCGLEAMYMWWLGEEEGEDGGRDADGSLMS
jgi:hypothetical protein